MTRYRSSHLVGNIEQIHRHKQSKRNNHQKERGMTVHWTMPAGLKIHYRQELEKYRGAFSKGDLQSAWRHLERAHIIGQPWSREHTYVHWLMLKFGVSIKSRREILGQIPRLLFGGVKSFVGKIPVGNTGGAGVPPLRPMEIPEELKQLMKPYLTA